MSRRHGLSSFLSLRLKQFHRANVTFTNFVKPFTSARSIAMAGRGRGAYYKALYGGGGRGRGSGRGHSGGSYGGDADASEVDSDASQFNANSWDLLVHKLNNIDREKYGAYKRLFGQYQHVNPQGQSFVLSIDSVQADPFAPPSRVRAVMPLSIANFPQYATSFKTASIALCDYVTRIAAKIIHEGQEMDFASRRGWSCPPKVFGINAPGNEVLERTSCLIDKNASTIEIRFHAHLPATGRTILGEFAKYLLTERIPALAYASLLFENHDEAKLKSHIDSVLDQESLRTQLDSNNLVAFIANGAILPRASGASSLPLSGTTVVPFQSPPEMQIELSRPNAGPVHGMGIPKGVTLLTGGGFHGKSTLLEALERGIYNYIPGDGRECVVSVRDSVKIRAEDGRSVTGVDITPFITDLPGGKSTAHFSTEDASGSTSMAATIQEYLSQGSKALLIDEDSSATNLLIRDARMQSLIRHEPITPLISRVRALHKYHGVSTIIVVGGLGDWLSVADTVIGMDTYRPACLNVEASAVMQAHPTHSLSQLEEYGSMSDRHIVRLPSGIAAGKGARVKQRSFIQIPRSRDDNETVDRTATDELHGVDISSLDQLAELGQTQLACQLLKTLAQRHQGKMLGTIGSELMQMHEQGGLDALTPGKRGDLVLLRWLDIVAVISRVRGLEVGHEDTS